MLGFLGFGFGLVGGLRVHYYLQVMKASVAGKVNTGPEPDRAGT